MSEHNPEVQESQVQENSVEENSSENSYSVEFHVDDSNHDYAKGVFMRRARELQVNFVDLYKEDSQATFRLTLERL